MGRPPRKHGALKLGKVVGDASVQLGKLKLGPHCSPACCIEKVWQPSPELAPPVQLKEASRIKAIVRRFNAVRRHLVPVEAERVREQGGGQPRPDIQAAKEITDLGEDNKWRGWGHVPGVRVGDQFHCRAELRVVGMHKQSMGGIDYFKDPVYEKHIAVSVVVSGGYEDDMDAGDEFLYTGQGGHDFLGNKQQIADQKFERGNAALYNSHALGIPVRVVRKMKEPNSYVGHVFTYDGLYYVVNGWNAKGKRGQKIFQFHLKRAPDQPKLRSPLVEFTPTSLHKTIRAKDRPGLIIPDLSNGLEPIPVCVVNTVDGTNPPEFKYITSLEVPRKLQRTAPAKGCKCAGGVCDPKTCACAKQNYRGRFAYTEGGLLMETVAKGIHECGPGCGCRGDCVNRVAQQGGKFRLEVFKTKNRGWGVRSWDAIPNGSHVSTYLGTLLEDSEAEALGEGFDTYFFGLGTLRKAKNWGRLEDEREDDSDTGLDDSLVIDAAHCGNVSRFINHSCEPNLVVQNVFKEQYDARRPSIEFFAAEDVKPLAELTYDYNYTVGSVVDREGRERKLECLCGSAECRKRLY